MKAIPCKTYSSGVKTSCTKSTAVSLYDSLHIYIQIQTTPSFFVKTNPQILLKIRECNPSLEHEFFGRVPGPNLRVHRRCRRSSRHHHHYYKCARNSLIWAPKITHNGPLKSVGVLCKLFFFGSWDSRKNSGINRHPIIKNGGLINAGLWVWLTAGILIKESRLRQKSGWSFASRGPDDKRSIILHLRPPHPGRIIFEKREKEVSQIPRQIVVPAAVSFLGLI